MGAQRGINQIEKYYNKFSENARLKAESLHARQEVELSQFAELIETIKKPASNDLRRKSIALATRKYF
jgi:hypothetical protein